MIAWKPKFNDPNVASVRYRCLNPLAELRRRGFQIELFREKSLESYSAVIFSKLYNDSNYQIALELRRRGKAVIVDVCDNHFYNPFGLEKFKIVRQQLMRMLSIADLTVASTETLADVLMEEGRLAVRPTVIGDAIEEGVSKPQSRKSWFNFNKVIRGSNPKSLSNDEKANLLWFGLHGGENAPYGMLDLLNQQDVLAVMEKSYPFRLIVVSNSRKKFLRHIEPLPFETHYYDWSLSTFEEMLRLSDVCIIPITKNPFTLCKSNNRLATALYMGIPTVADGIPSYCDLSHFCVLDDWEYGLRSYLADRVAAKEHARAARDYIEARYSIRQIGQQWAQHMSTFLS